MAFFNIPERKRHLLSEEQLAFVNALERDDPRVNRSSFEDVISREDNSAIDSPPTRKRSDGRKRD